MKEFIFTETGEIVKAYDRTNAIYRLIDLYWCQHDIKRLIGPSTVMTYHEYLTSTITPLHKDTV